MGATGLHVAIDIYHSGLRNVLGLTQLQRILQAIEDRHVHDSNFASGQRYGAHNGVPAHLAI